MHAHRSILLLLGAGLLGASLMSSCAWTNRDNRPVWNAFEEHAVPDGDLAFWATLPLTIPGGLVAIVIDTLIVHPAQVLDDAAADAGDLWRDREWQESYYTELASLPLRAAGTPLVFAGRFLQRAMFDLPRRKSEAEEQADHQAAQRHAVELTQAWLAAIAAGGDAPLGALPTPPPWDDALEQAFAGALAHGSAAGRSTLYRGAREHQLPPLQRDPALGLRDADPVVRYLELHAWPDPATLPEALRTVLLADPNEVVRALARTRFRG